MNSNSEKHKDSKLFSIFNFILPRFLPLLLLMLILMLFLCFIIGFVSKNIVVVG